MGSVPSKRKAVSNAHVWSDETRVYIDAIEAGLENEAVSRLCASVKLLNHVGRVSLTARGCLIIEPNYGTTDPVRQRQIRADLERWCAGTLNHRVKTRKGIAGQTPALAVR